MSYRNYTIPFFMSLAFWIIILFYLNVFLKAKIPKHNEIELTPIVLNPPKPINTPKQSPPKQIQKPPIPQKPITLKPQSIKPTPQQSISKPQTMPNLITSNNAPTSSPSIPKPLPKQTPISKPTNKPTKTSEGDYFKNAYTPPKPIYAPKPHIPQRLLPSVDEITLKVKFIVNKDGSCRAILLNPTPNPELNTLLVRELSNWKFFPATKAQKPISSSLVMEVHIKIE